MDKHNNQFNIIIFFKFKMKHFKRVRIIFRTITFLKLKHMLLASDLEFNYLFYNLKYLMQITIIFHEIQNSVLEEEKL